MWLEYFGGSDEAVFYGFCAVSGLVTILAIINIILSCSWRTRFHNGATSMDFVIVFGSLLLAYTVLVRGLDPEWDADLKQLDGICQSYPIFMLFGLTLFIGGLASKSYGILFFGKCNHHKSPFKEEFKANFLMWILGIIISVVILVWEIEYTPGISNKNSQSELKICSGDSFEEWQISTSAWHAFLLFLAALAIFPNCTSSHTLAERFETRCLTAIVLNTIAVVTAGLCVEYLYDIDENRTTYYAINGSLILWACLFANIMTLISRLCIADKYSATYRKQ